MLPRSALLTTWPGSWAAFEAPAEHSSKAHPGQLPAHLGRLADDPARSQGTQEKSRSSRLESWRSQENCQRRWQHSCQG